MEDLNRIAEIAIGSLKKHGAEKAHVEVGFREVHELNVEAGRFTLLRTTTDHGVSMRAITEQRQASLSGNQFSEPVLLALAEQTVATAKAGAPDEAFDISPKQSVKKMKSGPEEPDLDRLTSRAEEFLHATRMRFPKIILEAVTVQFVRRRRVIANSNGVHFETAQNDYEYSAMFTAKEGKKTSSFNYTGGSTVDFATPMMNTFGMEELLEQSSQAVNARALDGKFVGDVIITPHCLPTFIDGLTGYLHTGSLLKGQSVYQNKLNERIAAENFNLRAHPLDDRFSIPKFVTSDGFASENIDIVKDGVLKTFMLEQYGANKLIKARAKADDSHHVIDPGSSSLKDMIRSVKKGLLFCRYSHGSPASNGDVAGVAKNSFYIENGEILYPVNECMVSGNIPEMFLKIRGISQETLNFGTAELPWLQVSDVTISGK
jgi:PmbA protein